MKFTIKINLLALKNATLLKIRGKQEPKLCLVVPIEDNRLYIGEKGVYLDMTAFELRSTGRNGETHLLKQAIPKFAYKTMTEEERKNQPLLGTLKPVDNAAKTAAAAAKAPQGFVEDVDDNEELPF